MAPWTEGVLRRTGALQACCRNDLRLGDWLHRGLRGAWGGGEFQAFRRAILEGRYPTPDCRTCHENGGARDLAADLGGPFHRHLATLQAAAGPQPRLAALAGLLGRRRGDPETSAVLAAYAAAIEALPAGALPPEAARAAAALGTIGRVAAGFLSGELAPVEVAPFRQVELSDRCNARCIHCVFLHGGELEAGPMLAPKAAAEAFSCRGSIIDFFMYGAELLFFPGWKDVAALLAEAGVKLSVSSNGMLLTPANVRHLVDRRLLARLNVSLDGATAATVEAIRVNVRFDRVCAQLEDLVAYADAHQPDLELVLSFVLMRRNFGELPALVDLAARLKGGRKLRVVVSCSGLENYGIATYQAFLAEEHHSRLDRAELLGVFEETRARSRATGIPVGVFHSYALERFLELGAPFPPYPAQPSLRA